MAYCAPFVVLFALIDGARLRRLTTLRVWLELWAAAALVIVVTAPFLLPYLDVQRRLGIERGLDEIARYSATLDHYRIAMPGLLPAFVLSAIALLAALLQRPVRAMTIATLLLLALAFWLSLGPVPLSSGAPLGWPGLYRLLHDYVPGYNGLRVPARFAMLFFLFLALLAAFGVAALERVSWFAGRAIAVVALGVFLVQARPDAFPLDQQLPSTGLVSPPPAYLTPSAELPAVYRAVESLRPGAVLAELPFGDSWYDLRYMYFAGIHRRRLLNGYSGLFPPSYLARQRVLVQPLLDPPASAQALGGASHVVIHRAGWRDDTGARLGAWLEQFGATKIAEADGAALYELPAREALADY
jgi:hypothetical protein